MPWGKRAFSRTFFPGFLGPEAHKLSVPPVKLAKAVFSAKLAISPERVQGDHPPGWGLGQTAPAFPLVCFSIVVFTLHTDTVNSIKSYQKKHSIMPD